MQEFWKSMKRLLKLQGTIQIFTLVNWICSVESKITLLEKSPVLLDSWLGVPLTTALVNQECK